LPACAFAARAGSVLDSAATQSGPAMGHCVLLRQPHAAGIPCMAFACSPRLPSGPSATRCGIPLLIFGDPLGNRGAAQGPPEYRSRPSGGWDISLEPAPAITHFGEHASMKIYESLADLKPLVGEPIGSSDWVLVDQERIDRFADATGDHQWIHVDPSRASKGPYGMPIAHGFLTLSLLPAFFATAFEIRRSTMGVNYGLNKVRFMRPVPVGSRLRGHFKLLSWEALENDGAQMNIEMLVEREGDAKPVCVAESITRRYP
jgi:acyl dehydratase